jgi:hypothetical protein
MGAPTMRVAAKKVAHKGPLLHNVDEACSPAYVDITDTALVTR